MASVAPVVTSTSSSGESSRPYQRRLVGRDGGPQLGHALARRVLVAPGRDGRGRHPGQLGRAVGVGKSLAEVEGPVARASSDISEKIVVVKARSRSARTFGLGAARTRWYRWPIVCPNRAHRRQLQHACRDRRVGPALRPVAVCAAFDADVLVLEEAWTNDAEGPGSGQAERVAAALGYQVVTCTLAEGRRPLPIPTATERWMPHLGFRAEKRSLYLGSARPLPAPSWRAPRYRRAKPGSWGIAVLTRGDMVVEGTRTLHLPPLRRDRVRRAAIVVDMTSEGVPLSVVGTHMSHLQYGSHRHYCRAERLLRTEATTRGRPAGRHEPVGPAGPGLPAGLAPGREGPHLAGLAPPQPDRPHPGPRRRRVGSAKCCPPPARTIARSGPN